MKLPDITPAQIAAALGWVLAQFVALHWIDNTPDQVTIMAGATVLAAAWKYADAKIRVGRNVARAASISTAGPAVGDPAKQKAKAKPRAR